MRSSLLLICERLLTISEMVKRVNKPFELAAKARPTTYSINSARGPNQRARIRRHRGSSNARLPLQIDGC